jgi:hypothetical protein
MAYTVVDNPREYFNTVLYTGNGSTNAITGVGFQPDWVWVKGRTNTPNHYLFDSVRGVQKNIHSNTTDAEATGANTLTAFGSDGFTLGSDGDPNGSGQNYVGWNWLANGTGVSNTQGSIASTVSANTTSGFSIVSYTGNATAGATVGHGLGVAPDVVICKQTGGANDWMSYHSVLGNTKSMRLNATDAVQTATTYWNDTSPTSIVFSLGSDTKGNASSTMIAYCFAEKKGFSKFGSYTGNGSTDGTFIYTGFKPAYFVIKRTDTTENWYCTDIKRNPINPVTGNLLLLNKTDAEISTSYPVDFLSNGFKIRGNNNITNASGGSYIYMAFAENPFVTSTSIPTTAR